MADALTEAAAQLRKAKSIQEKLARNLSRVRESTEDLDADRFDDKESLLAHHKMVVSMLCDFIEIALPKQRLLGAQIQELNGLLESFS